MTIPPQQSNIPMEQKQEADMQIRACGKRMDYDTKDFTIGSLVTQFNQGEICIAPDYRRDPWDTHLQNLFLESILLDLSTPILSLADCTDERLEIIDGVQRIQTIAAFQANAFRLTGLEILTALNGFSFADLSDLQQRRFLNKSMRVVVYDKDTSEASRWNLAHRMNQACAKMNDAKPCGAYGKGCARLCPKMP